MSINTEHFSSPNHSICVFFRSILAIQIIRFVFSSRAFSSPNHSIRFVSSEFRKKWISFQKILKKGCRKLNFPKQSAMFGKSTSLKLTQPCNNWSITRCIITSRRWIPNCGNIAKSALIMSTLDSTIATNLSWDKVQKRLSKVKGEKQKTLTWD